MLNWLTDASAYEYKLACDGFDLKQKPAMQDRLNSLAINYIDRHCLLSNFLEVEHFISQCIADRRKAEPDHCLPITLRDKYEVGKFTVSLDNCFNNDYILFNKEQLEFWKEASEVGTDLIGLEFLVIASRDWTGKINELGFRILDKNRVRSAFKWLFPYGQQATFGLNFCDPNKQLILCEGAWDYIALRESDYSNIVGLGSLKLTDRHKKELRTENYGFCLDGDYWGLESEIDKGKQVYLFIPEAKDPFDAFIQHGKIKLIKVS